MSAKNIFDFEKPIVELENRLAEMREIAGDNGVEMDSAIDE